MKKHSVPRFAPGLEFFAVYGTMRTGARLYGQHCSLWNALREYCLWKAEGHKRVALYLQRGGKFQRIDVRTEFRACPK